MAKAPFISYSHKQEKWVWDKLTPILRAAGCVDLRIDRERFTAGRGVKGQMDKEQDAAEVSVLVLSADYLASDYCCHEMDRAIAKDPDFSSGLTIPIVLDDAGKTAFDRLALPSPPIWVELKDDSVCATWQLLLKSLEAANLRASAPHWLDVRNALVQKYKDQQMSTNLVIHGNPNWRDLVKHFQDDWHPGLAVVNLDNPVTASLEGLVKCILNAFGITHHVPAGNGAVAALSELTSLPGTLSLAILHGDNVLVRKESYGYEIFHTLRYLISDEKKLALLMESRTPFSQLLPKDHPLSSLHLHTVELHGASQ